MTTPLIRQLTLKNFLSFGPEGFSLELRPLNVLIGPNASGKSNLLEALTILRGAAGDLQAVIREGGGVGEFLWKGEQLSTTAVVEGVITFSGPIPDLTLRHRLELAASGPRLTLAREALTLHRDDDLFDLPEVVVHREAGNSLLRATVRKDARDETRPDDLNAGQSVLSQRRDPDRYPEITFLGDLFGGITLFQEWSFGRHSPPRRPQPTDLPTDFLLPDASNLGLILHDLLQTSAKRDEVIHYLRRFYEHARFISTRIQGGPLQLYIEEEGGRQIPASRLSDGTLRYLSLLAILLHPNPPPVIGIEEPELGLHPDILPTIAELLKKASERTQLFVTTHSDALISALSDVPESVLVCERMPNGTVMERLQPEKLATWLDEYRLGEVWRMGELGGNRW